MLLLSNAVLIAVKAKGNWRLPKQISHFKQWYLKVPRVNENLIALRLLRFVFNSCNLLNMGFWILSFSSVDIVIATYCCFHQLSQFIIAVSNVVNHRTPRQCSNIDDFCLFLFNVNTDLQERSYNKWNKNIILNLFAPWHATHGFRFYPLKTRFSIWSQFFTDLSAFLAVSTKPEDLQLSFRQIFQDGYELAID